MRATLVGDNQLAASATLTAQSGSATTFASGSSLTLASGATLTLPAASVPWAALTTTPTTLAGYGIADAYSSPLTTAGDLLYGGTSGAPTRLAIGSTGQVLSVSSGGLPVWSAVSGTGTVTSITAGTGLTGGTITGSGTLGLGTSGVTAGSYGGASAVPVLTVDATGRITAASTATVAALANPMTSPGDLIYGGSLGTPTRLAIGTAGQVLKVNSAGTGYEFGAGSSGLTTLTWASSVELSFAAPMQSVTLTGNTTFTTANRAAGAQISLRIITDTTTRTLNWPSGWVWLGGAAPTGQAARKTALLSLLSFGTADDNVVAAYAVQP